MNIEHFKCFNQFNRWSIFIILVKAIFHKSYFDGKVSSNRPLTLVKRLWINSSIQKLLFLARVPKLGSCCSMFWNHIFNDRARSLFFIIFLFSFSYNHNFFPPLHLHSWFAPVDFMLWSMFSVHFSSYLLNGVDSEHPAHDLGSTQGALSIELYSLSKMYPIEYCWKFSKIIKMCKISLAL